MTYDAINNVYRLSSSEIERLRRLKADKGSDFVVTHFVPDDVPRGQGFKIGSCHYTDRHDPLAFVRVSQIVSRRYSISLGELAYLTAAATPPSDYQCREDGGYTARYYCQPATAEGEHGSSEL